MNNHVHTSHSLAETETIAKAWLADISTKYLENPSDVAVIVGLSGHLGTGKTAFVKIIARELGIKEDITSPTFVIMKLYAINSKDVPWKRLVHIDAYRLEHKEELEALRFEDIVTDKNNLILVEWPEQVGLENFGEKERLSFEMKDNICTIKRSNPKIG
ncbi:MAG: tRNA (adenosine(37)-N6)-threonylcarbamoyltransferase complex ATPase subunit type 1 TsaE [Candidatus Paceibacterota bacterium]|jgi:tRNA threonylcarbamoyl adenosine modification protein YjeE